MRGTKAKRIRRAVQDRMPTDATVQTQYMEKPGTRRKVMVKAMELQPDGTRKEVQKLFTETFTILVAPTCQRYWQRMAKRLLRRLPKEIHA